MTIINQSVNDFYHDLKQDKVRYRKKMAPLCIEPSKRCDHKSDRYALFEEKPLYGHINANRKILFYKYGYYKIYDTVQKSGKYADDVINDVVNDSNLHGVICDNKFLREHHEEDYRAVILNGFNDYVLNYFPKITHTTNADLKIMPTACVVLLNLDGSYFYAAPINLNRLYPHYSDSDEINLVKSNESDVIENENTQVSVIETDLATIQAILDKVSLRKARYQQRYDEDSYVKDNNDNDYLAYSTEYKLKEVAYYDYEHSDSDDAEKVSTYCFGINRSGKYADDKFNHRVSLIRDWVSDHLHSDYDENGEIHYQLKPTNDFWTKFTKQISTQNLNHNLLVEEYYGSKEVTNFRVGMLARNNWHDFKPAQVENIEIKSASNLKLEPLAKPHGLNRIFNILDCQSHDDLFANGDQLFELESSRGSNNAVKVRRYQL